MHDFTVVDVGLTGGVVLRCVLLMVGCWEVSCWRLFWMLGERKEAL